MTFQNKIDPDLIPLVGQGNDRRRDRRRHRASSRPSARASRSSTSPRSTASSRRSCSQETSSGIKTAAKLKGKKLGIPGKYGSSLDHAPGPARVGVADARRPADRRIPGLRPGRRGRRRGGRCRHRLREQRAGRSSSWPATPTTVLHVDDITPLPGPGPDRRHEDARDQARRHAGVRRRHPARPCRRSRPTRQVGLDAAIEAVPELAQRATGAGGHPRRDHRRRGPARSRRPSGLGAIDADGWATSITYLTTLGLVPNAVTVQDVLAEGYVPGHTHEAAARHRADGSSTSRSSTSRRRPRGRSGRRRRAGRGGCARRWPPKRRPRPSSGRVRPRRRCAARPRPTSSSSAAATPGCGRRIA